MKTLEDFKNEVATKIGYNSFDEVFAIGNKEMIKDCMEASAILFACYVQEEIIEACVKNAKIKTIYRQVGNRKFLPEEVVDKQSILNIERILK